MIVVIEDEVFASPPSPSALLSIFHLGFQGRHRIQTDPLYPAPGSHLDRWLDQITDESLQEEVKLALEAGLKQDARGLPSDVSVRVWTHPETDWRSSPPRLPLAAALRFLHSPLRLLVENRHNDGAFLQAVAPSSVRAELEAALREHWIEFEHGGGADMKTRVTTVTREDAMRLWVLSDSDAREPGHPAPFQQALRQLCQERGVAHHLLERRASENYLPHRALEDWVYWGPKSAQEPRRNTHRSFARLRPEQRHHYNMKHGFTGDRPDIPALFADCVDHPHLQNGFGGDIAARFQQPIQEEWLRKDGQQAETLAMVQSILRRL